MAQVAGKATGGNGCEFTGNGTEMCIRDRDNAAILAAQMLALSDESIAKQLHQMKVDMEQGVAKKNEALQQKVAEL